MGIQVRVEKWVGEIRAAAFNDDAQPFALFLDRCSAEKKRARLGDVHAARLRKISPEQGGGFAELENGESVFLRRSALKGRAEGERFNVKIEAEHRRGKAPRVSITSDRPHIPDPFETWLSDMPCEGTADIIETHPGDELIEAAFDEALSPFTVLPGGGVVRFSETPALVAIDIDTAGRNDRGRSYDRALNVNLEAAEEAARQLNLRGLGGLAAIDCVAPLRKEAGGSIKLAFLKAFRSYSTRKAEALAPSPFGLLEASLAWRRSPISHVLLDDAGRFSSHAEFLKSLRSLERELTCDRVGSYALAISPAHHAIWQSMRDIIDRKLKSRYGARFTVTLAENDGSEVRKI